MTKKLKSLNPIIGTGYKTLSTIKDGEDGNIENFPDTLPKIPRLSYKRLGVSGLEIGWEFEDKIYYTYELYGSTTKGFKASEENLIFQGLASSYFYEAKPGEKWYFKARAKNTHGRYTEFSSELVTYTIKLDNLGDYVEGGSINGALIENATINNAHIKDLHADKITAGVLDADRIGANSITANKIEANAITSEKIQANAITTDKLAANIIASNHIQSGTITSGHIQSGTIESGHIKAGTIESNHIKSNSINSNHIQANTIQSEHIQTGAITAGSGIIAEGAIGSAQISSLDASKIEAGTIDTSKVIIQGSNGHLRIKGNRLQVFNGTGNQAKERVSVGDVNGDGTIYGLRVRGADGKTVLLDENGVKSEGITNGAITNDKISDNAEIDGAKLNINSVVNKINEDGTETIQGTKIEVNGTSLVTKLSSITNKQTEDSNKITQAQSQITANTNAIKLKVDEQTYQSDKEGIETSLNKHTSEISTMKGQIALKVEQTDIANAKSELEGKIDTKVASAKAEIKVTTDSISQSVSNLSNTVSTKADGTTVSNLSSKVSTLETNVNGITGRVSNVEKTTTTLGTQVDTAQSTADSAVNKADKAQTTANTNKNNISSLQGEVSTVKSNVASLEVTTSGISQKVSNVESTTATLTTKVNTAQSTANTASTNATNALNTANTANTLAGTKAKVFTSTPTVPYQVGDLWVQGTSGDVMRCKTTRSSGSYTASDWEKASKYTDDTTANAVNNKVTTLQTDYNSTKSKVASIETNLDSITQRVSSTESTNVTLTEKVNVTVKDVKVYYAINSSSTTAPTSGWSTTPPTWAEGKYIWSKTTTTLTNGNSTTTNPVCITGAKGATGATGAKGDKGDTGATGASGKGVSSITNYYLATTSSSGVTTSTSGWTTTVQSVSSSKKYLWNYEKVTYTDNTSTNTTPCIIGAYGDTGATGATGAAGKGIKSIVEYYAVSSSNTTAPTSWSTTMQNTTTTNKYLWNYEVITYTDNSTTSTTKKVIGTHGATGSQGAKGDTGATGTGIESITTEYYLSTSKTTQTGGSWVTTQPQWSNGKYLWTRSKIVYKNPTSTAYTTPVCDSSWDAINDIEIGGRNLLKDTNKGNVGWSWGLGGSQSGYYSISSHICEDSTNGVKFKRNETEFSPTWNYVSYSGSKIVGNKIKPNTEYTLSMEVKSSVACSIRWSIKYGDSTNTMVKDSSLMQIEKDKWVKFKVASTSLSTLPNFSSNHCIYLTGFPSSANCEFYIKNIKLEEGNKATDWTPAPEDVQSQIDTNKANISTTSSKVAEITTDLNSITQRVSSTESTVSTHTTQLGTVDTRINNAKNSAISTASSDATTKANNALASAKTDATTKANNALADAKTYTNGQITTVNTTINNKVAEIKATTDAITQRVSSTESNLTTTTSKIDNLTIGGNNHIINGAFALDGYWTHWGSPAIREYITRDNKRWCHIKGSGTALYQGISQNQYNNGITVKPNTQYTVSADVYGGASNQVFTVGIHWIDSSGSIISQPWNNFTVGTTPQKVHFTVTTPSNVRNFNIMVGVNHASIAYDVYFTNLKFELGNKATDYSPSPQETQHQINNNKESLTSLTTTVNNTNSKVSSLETNLNSITSRVSATETTTSSLTTQMSNKEDVNSRVIYAKGNGNDAPSNSIVKVGSSALVSGHGRGLNIVALNPTTLAQYYKGTFDTYGGDNYRTQFAEKIQELNNGNYIIVVTSHDSACLNYATVCNALYLIGGSAPSTSIASYREAYALIGKSRLGKGNGLEMYIPKTADNARVAEVSVKVSEQGALLGVNSNNSESKIDTLTTRVSTAESKLTKDSLTTTIGSHYTTSTDVNNAITSKGYATTSQVQQTTDALSAKFSSSGGYNLLRNTSFANGATHWNHNATCTVDSSKKYGSNNSLKMVSSGATSAVWRGANQRFVDNAPIGKTYRATLYYYIEDKSTFNSNFTLELKGRKTGATSESGFVSTSISASNLVQGAWTKVTVTATTSVAWDYMYIYPWIHMSGTIWISDVIVTEGELEVPWSPHPSEIYDGVTTIDKNGVKVSQSNYNGYTQMKADGFYVNNGSENVISVTSSGATFKGKVTIQSGSTVPTSTLSGTISSGQLESTITNDISTAKTNASSALSTANTAKSTADTAKSTANTANAQATTNKNNISTLTTTVTNTNNKVSTLETNLSGITSRVGTVETKTTTLEGKVTSHESRIKTAENKITDSAIINTVSSTIDSKVNAGVSNIKLGGRNYIYYGKGDVKKGFFTSFNKVDDGYGEHTLTSQKTYTSVGIGNGFLLGCRDYEVGKQITFSYEIMYTKWDFPAGTNRSEFWMGQRYTGGTTESSDGAWRSVTSHTLPEVGKNGCELNKWFKVEKVITIPQQAHSSIGTASSIQFYNSNADVSASVTFRLRNVKIEYGNKATDWTPSPEETENIISDTEKLLNENIDNAISDVQNSILQNVSDNYATSEKLDILSQTVSSNMTQTNNNINMQFETATNYTKEVDGKLQNFQNTVGTHIRFSENGIDLGKTNSPFTATLDNTQLAFKQDGSTVAYISNNKMHITQAEIKESLRVGTNENGYFSWVQGPKGNLSLKWSDK